MDRKFQLLYQCLSDLGINDQPTIELIFPYCQPLSYTKSEHLHRDGTPAKNIFFICEGLVRFYYCTADGKEFNKSFAHENQFAGAIQVSHSGVIPRYSIQALEDTSTLAIPLDALQHLFASSHQWANLGRLYFESVAVRKEQREAEFLLDSAEQRYRNFLNDYPQLVDRLPLYHIASYLGITDVALSRIRKQIRLNPG